MKNITTKTEKTRNINGGVGVVSVMAAMGTIYGAIEACKWAWDTGAAIGTAIGKKVFKK